MSTSPYLWDKNKVRYHLFHSNSGPAYNWLFVPGGPGADSCYFSSLITGLDLPGNIWLIDLPANGSNEANAQSDYDFDQWFDCFLPAIEKFPNPIYVGHSFGGMFPLFFPQLENILKGFVILNSTPSLWLEEAAKMASEKNIRISLKPVEEFTVNPNQETFQNALAACMPYYFPAHSLEKGKALLASVPTNFRAAVWWLKKAVEINFNAVWAPCKIPTLILGGSEDCITPFSIFAQDARFHKENIILKKIANAGHFPWIENMQAVEDAFRHLIVMLKPHNF